MDKQAALAHLRQEYRDDNLTLYLGAGISVASKIPSWEKLVLLMYFSKISQEKMEGWRPFSNYLYAIAEWHLANKQEPLEITARKLRMHYRGAGREQEFYNDLYLSLYGNLLEFGEPAPWASRNLLRDTNRTLDSAARLCEARPGGVRAVITYNYDNLLEIALGDTPHHAIYRADTGIAESPPIYHVHGYVPLDRNTEQSRGDEIVFTEDQYHRVAENPYSWSNLVQLQLMSSTVGLMIGLSLSDRNMRRLLDAVHNSPLGTTNYALLKKPDKTPTEVSEIEAIQQRAIEYLDDFEGSGVKSARSVGESILFPRPGIKAARPVRDPSDPRASMPRYQYEIGAIIDQVKQIDSEQQEFVLQQLGITPLWVEDFDEIPEIIDQITS